MKCVLCIWPIQVHTHLEQWTHTVVNTHTPCTHLEQWTHTHSSEHTHTPCTHLEQWTHTHSSEHTHTPCTHLEQWTHTHSSEHTHTPCTHTWSSGHCSLRRSSSTATACNFIQDSLVWNTLNYINTYYWTIISPISISIEINYLFSP